MKLIAANFFDWHEALQTTVVGCHLSAGGRRVPLSAVITHTCTYNFPDGFLANKVDCCATKKINPGPCRSSIYSAAILHFWKLHSAWIMTYVSKDGLFSIVFLLLSAITDPESDGCGAVKCAFKNRYQPLKVETFFYSSYMLVLSLEWIHINTVTQFDCVMDSIFSGSNSSVRENATAKRRKAFRGKCWWDFREKVSVGVRRCLWTGLLALCTTSSTLPPTGIWWQTRFNLPAMSSWVQLLIALCGGVAHLVRNKF